MTKYALCVGNNYPGTDNELSGCVNDANDWGELLARQGYDVTAVNEGGATQVLDLLREAVRGLGFADRMVFTYSGHGTWMPDQSGDESDFRDEAMYMADGNLIMDDDLDAVFQGIPYGAGVLTLSDSCFSGTVSRFWGRAPVGEGKPRFISPSEFTNLSREEAAHIERATISTPPRKTSSLISGCTDEEYSYDAHFAGRGNGAFTRAAIDAYVPGMSLNSWHKAIRVRLPSASYPQTPLLTSASLYRRYAKAL